MVSKKMYIPIIPNTSIIMKTVPSSCVKIFEIGVRKMPKMISIIVVTKIMNMRVNLEYFFA